MRLALENMRRRDDAPNRAGMRGDDLSVIIEGTDESVVGLCYDTEHATSVRMKI